LKASGRFDVIGSFSNPIEAISFVNSNEVDVIFLDVEMPELSGLDFAKVITSKAKVIITTSEKNYAIDAFEINAFDFLLKPVELSKLAAVAAKLDKNSDVNISSKPVFLKTKEGFIKIELDTVLYVSAEADYVFYHTEEKRFIARQSMTQVLEVCGPNFVQVHRSYIVNLNNVISFSSDKIEVGKERIPLSRGHRDNFQNRINKIG
jgi:DNA-binding LytR/AlgR family response regulator